MTPKSPKSTGLELNRAERLILQLQKAVCKEVLVLGDSHAQIFSSRELRAAFPLYYFNVVAVHGATVSGLENPNSKTQAMPTFMDNFDRSKANTVIVSIGEVDIGFVVWYRAEKYKTEVSSILDDVLRSYQKFLLLLAKDHRVFCVSVPLPTIKDGQEWGKVANARREVNASQRDRTKLTVRFNKSVSAFCEKEGIQYLNFDDESIGDDGLVDVRLLNKIPTDHHYEPLAYVAMMVPKLKRAFRSR